MAEVRITVGHSTGVNPGVNGGRDLLCILRQLREAESHHVCIDLSALQHIEPFGTLVLASALRRRMERSELRTEFEGIDESRQGHHFAGRMGLWQQLGLHRGAPAPATSDTIPITCLEWDKLYRKAGARDPVRAGVVSDSAGEIATVLLKSNERTAAWLALEYSFREMFRNAFEHSGSSRVWYCASTWQTERKVQIGILDEGCGIRKSFGDRFASMSDAEVLKEALTPGVSSKSERVRTLQQTERLLEEFPGEDPRRYDNSGLGLSYTAEIARTAGAFGLLSDTAWIAFAADGSSWDGPDSWHPGTAVRIILELDKLEHAMQVVGLVGAERPVYSHTAVLTASMMTRLGFAKLPPR